MNIDHSGVSYDSTLEAMSDGYTDHGVGNDGGIKSIHLGE